MLLNPVGKLKSQLSFTDSPEADDCKLLALLPDEKPLLEVFKYIFASGKVLVADRGKGILRRTADKGTRFPMRNSCNMMRLAFVRSHAVKL